MKFVGLFDLMGLVGVDAHIDPLLLAFSRARRGGRPCPPDLTAEYFDYLAGLPDTHLHRVSLI